MTAQRRIHGKPIVYRRAVASGSLRLSPKGRTAIRKQQVDKGDPIQAGEIAGLQAMKRTSELIPHCHVVPLTGSRIDLRLNSEGVHVQAEAETVGRTGVEMEALVGATVALLTVWDMVKYVEKNRRGLYPQTSLGPVRVEVKEKRSVRSER